MADADPVVELLMEHLADYGDEAVWLRADLRPRYAAQMASDVRGLIEGPVRALHRAHAFPHADDADRCEACWRVYPCPTIRAMGGSDG